MSIVSASLKGVLKAKYGIGDGEESAEDLPGLYYLSREELFRILAPKPTAEKRLK